MTRYRFLIHPGWGNSGKEHWQSYWERNLGSQAERIRQHDWFYPQPDDWEATALEAIASQTEPVVIVAHSLGCVVTAKLLSQPLAPVAAAILVAPADIERPGAPQELVGFAPISLAPLTAPSLVIASSSDPFCSSNRSEDFARAWGADYWNLGDAGHINFDAGFGPWTEGWEYVTNWLADNVKSKDMEAEVEKSR